jgi:hypothetical protein
VRGRTIGEIRKTREEEGKGKKKREMKGMSIGAFRRYLESMKHTLLNVETRVKYGQATNMTFLSIPTQLIASQSANISCNFARPHHASCADQQRF